MKKTKELLLFLAALIMPIPIFFVILFFSPVSNSHFVGIENYLRLFFHDKTFGKALFNTIFMPFIFSFLSVALFAVIVFIVRKKTKAPRKVFYISSVFVGAITALLCTVYVNIALSAQQYATHTLVLHIVDYSPTVFDVITISNVLLCLYIGVFTAFIFWIIELIVGIVKNSKKICRKVTDG